MSWTIERIVHFAPGDLVNDGFVHFGFHDRNGRHYVIDHLHHFVGLVGADDELELTVAAESVFAGTPNIAADLQFPMYVDSLADESLVISNLGNARLYRVDPKRMRAQLLVDGRERGLVDLGNCVVDDHGFVWANEVEGCRLWRFDPGGRTVLVLGDGTPGFQPHAASFEQVRFNWIYDIRRGPNDTIYVLDSGNFALRVVDIADRTVRTVAGTGDPGYTGDGADARTATFGSDPTARFDGPISLSLDELANAYVGDRFNHVVRMIRGDTGVITTIAGRPHADPQRANNPDQRDPLRLNLPQISSMDYHQGRLLVPTDLTHDRGDLIVMRQNPRAADANDDA